MKIAYPRLFFATDIHNVLKNCHWYFYRYIFDIAATFESKIFSYFSPQFLINSILTSILILYSRFFFETIKCLLNLAKKSPLLNLQKARNCSFTIHLEGKA